MPGIGGLSIANNLLSNAVQLNLDDNQKALQASTTRLSSGLRINAAADDPSGIAISQTLQAQVNGFDQASQNVQNATNAAQVADGALQTTTDILQRIRSLAVEAASDISSSSDKQDVQTEISQLLLEVNRVAQNTQFNGIALLDGSHAGFQGEVSATVTVQTNAALASAGPSTTYADRTWYFDDAGVPVSPPNLPQLPSNFVASVNTGLLVASAIGIGAISAPRSGPLPTGCRESKASRPPA